MDLVHRVQIFAPSTFIDVQYLLFGHTFRTGSIRENTCSGEFNQYKNNGG